MTFLLRKDKIGSKEECSYGIFDEIGKTLADKSREAAKKAKDVAEILQLKAQISTEKSKTKELYASIGVRISKSTVTTRMMNTRCSSRRSRKPWPTSQNWRSG